MAIKLKEIHPDNLRRLFEDEIEDPDQVVQTFFENFPLRSCYNELWDLYKGYMASDYASCNASNQLSGIVYFYERLEAVLEATYLIHTNKGSLIDEPPR